MRVPIVRPTRSSRGASRGRIVRQLFIESLLLALVASLAGFALGRFTLDAGIRAVYATLPPGGGRIGLTLAVALSTALASTLVMMDTFDVAAFSAGIVIVIAACLVAAFYPARRAAGVEPWLALRIE